VPDLSANVKQEISQECHDRLPMSEWRNSFGQQLINSTSWRRSRGWNFP